MSKYDFVNTFPRSNTDMILQQQFGNPGSSREIPGSTVNNWVGVGTLYSRFNVPRSNIDMEMQKKWGNPGSLRESFDNSGSDNLLGVGPNNVNPYQRSSADLDMQKKWGNPSSFRSDVSEGYRSLVFDDPYNLYSYKIQYSSKNPCNK